MEVINTVPLEVEFELVVVDGVEVGLAVVSCFVLEALVLVLVHVVQVLVVERVVLLVMHVVFVVVVAGRQVLRESTCKLGPSGRVLSEDCLAVLVLFMRIIGYYE